MACGVVLGTPAVNACGKAGGGVMKKSVLAALLLLSFGRLAFAFDIPTEELEEANTSNPSNQ